MSVQYAKARSIRNTSFGDLISKNLMNNKSITSSVGSAMSDKFKSQLVGVKEHFDPLNIARRLTGNIGATLIGKMIGRSNRDISFFTGIHGSKNEDPLHTKISDGQSQRLRKGDALSDVVAKLYNITKKYHTEDIERMEDQQNFRKTRQEETENWQKEVLEALTGVKKTKEVPTAKKEEPEDKNKGLWERVKDWFQEWDSLKSAFNLIKKLGSGVWKGLLTIGEALASPAAIWLLTIGAGAIMAWWLGTKLKNAIETAQDENALKLGGPEAVTALHKEQDNRDALNESGMQTADQEDATEEREKAIQKKQDAIGTYMLQKGYDRYNVKNLWGGKTWEYVYRKGGPNGQLAPQSLVDEAEKAVTGKTEVPSPVKTATKMELPKEVKPSTAGAGRGSAIPQTATETQPRPNPLGQKVQQVVTENNDLQNSTTGGQTVVVDNSKRINNGVNTPSTPSMPGSAPVRNDDDTTASVQRNNYRPV